MYQQAIAAKITDDRKCQQSPDRNKNFHLPVYKYETHVV